MTVYRLVRPNGDIEFQTTDNPDRLKSHSHACEPEPNREPETPYEDFDPDLWAWVTDHARKAETESARADREDDRTLSIRLAHQTKAIEARLILSGQPELAPLLTREAEAVGTTPTELANTVLEKAQIDIQRELDRRATKLLGTVPTE